MTLATALRTGDVTQLPGKRDEDWRWTDLRGLLRTLPPLAPDVAAPSAPGPFAGLADVELLVVNGRLLGPVDALILAPGEKRVVALRFIAATDAASSLSELVISVGEGAELTLLETYEAHAAAYVADVRLDIALAPGAVVERVVLAADAADAVSVSTAEVVIAPNARFGQTVLTRGAKRQRIETRLAHPGGGAEARLDAVYLLDAKAHADLTTEVRHQGAEGGTRQLAKGVVRDQSRGVFQGRIVVEEGADQTDARMGHHALILSDQAEVDARPELLIFADDVQCAHGNTIGALDDEALFYMRQRGLPEAEARALLMAAFVGEVVDGVVHEGAREAARAWLLDRLGAVA